MENLLNNLRNSNFWEHLINENTQVDQLIAYTTSIDFERNEKKIFQNILLKLDKEFDIPSDYLSLRVFISGFIVFKDPDSLLSKNRQTIEDNLYNKSIEIFNLINDKSSDFKLLGKKVLTFKIIFDEWKEKDLESQMDILCEVYYRYKEQLNDVPTEIMNNSNKEIINFIAKIEKSMKRLTPKYKEYLENYKFKKVSFDDKANNIIYKKLKSTYWKYIENKIFEEKNYKIIDRIIDDYSDLIQDINVNDLDISPIEEFKGIYTIESLIALANAMINVNKCIDSEHYDDIYAYVTEKLIKSNNYLCDIFKFLFERLEFIKNVKTTVYQNN